MGPTTRIGPIRPNAIAFAAVMVLIAGLATIADPPGSAGEATAIVIEDFTSDDGGPQDRPPTEPSHDERAPEEAPAPTDSEPTSSPDASETEPSATPTGEPPPTQTPTAAPPTPEPPPSPAYPEAPLYDGAAKFRGMTDDSLRLCGHAALIAAAAFDTSERDLNVYWEWVNDNGGVHGRKVTFSWEDDAYQASQAVTAAETCAGRNPFFIVGGIGFDQIPGVRTWAERNRELYFHHIAVAPDRTYDYSFSLQPTVEQMGQEFGRMLVSKYADATIGIMWRNSDNWRPGRDAGVEVMKEAGVTIAADHAVLQNQGVYNAQLNDMRMKGVDVVWVWENALITAQIINQASSMGYRPTWVVFPFQTTLDILTNPGQLEVVGGATWPAYIPGGYGQDWAQFGLPDEIELFESVYRQYRPNTTPNEMLFMVWTGFKTMHEMLLDCGVDCNRNRFAGMMLSGYSGHIKPMCPFSFAGARSFGGHHGVSQFFEQQVFRQANGRPAFKTSRYCTSTLG